MSIFGSTTQNTSNSTPNPFGTGTTSIFGQQNNQQNQAQAKPNPFLNVGPKLNTNTSQPQQQSIFSSLGQPAQQNTSQPSGQFGFSQPQQTGTLFGQPQSQPQQTSGIFGSTQNAANTQQTSSIFSNPLGQGQSSIFGQPQQQQQQQQPSVFNSGVTQQQQQPQQPPQQLPQQGSVFGQSQPSIFRQTEVWPRKWSSGSSKAPADNLRLPGPRSVADQIEVAFQKWNPESPISLFQTYIYNFTDPKFVPFCQPGENDNPTKWEEAVSRRPHPGAVPVLVKGFSQLGQRMLLQKQLLKVLQGRLHEINNGLTEMLRRHDLEISVRAAEARKRHLRLNQQCMRLATKVQVLRNRGYAMDSAEEELKMKLLALEKKVMDPALNGRGEEIWARMVSVRERGRQLQKEFEKAGRAVPREQEQAMDAEVMKKATKILEDYSSQLAHLAKELEQLQKDFKEWNDGRPDVTRSIGRA
ncbi:MAG: hypothetical protein LQ348_002327 [Seirophora lacunosa]|nr:MAG: hypothetical protein LQ348_002327 [Seirophora lacunosa]